jgi:hypothetical protein
VQRIWLKVDVGERRTEVAAIVREEYLLLGHDQTASDDIILFKLWPKFFARGVSVVHIPI